MNYLVIDRQSNLIKLVVTSPHLPPSNTYTLFLPVGDLALSKYYKLKKKSDKEGRLVDAGALASVSDSVQCLLARKVQMYPP